MDGLRLLAVGTDEPFGPSKGSAEYILGKGLAADGSLVYAARMTAAASDAALRGLNEWATTDGAIETPAIRAANLPVPLLHSTYVLKGSIDEELRQARIAVGVPLHPFFDDVSDEDDD